MLLCIDIIKHGAIIIKLRCILFQLAFQLLPQHLHRLQRLAPQPQRQLLAVNQVCSVYAFNCCTFLGRGINCFFLGENPSSGINLTPYGGTSEGHEGDNEEVMLYASIGGGIVGFLILIVIFILIVIHHRRYFYFSLYFILYYITNIVLCVSFQ